VIVAAWKEHWMTPEEKLAELGYSLETPKPYPPAMVAGKIVGNLLYLSGATPPTRFGTTWKGRVGDTYSVEQGYQAARETAVIQLEMAKHILGGDLGRIKQVVKVLGMVNCAPGFTDTPAVMHGFSELLFEVLGERGRHARSAVGMQALPGDAPIEVETIFEIERGDGF
jgi:enamine deaminase RidA (YjgF/YER057c/UK114 family)